jgi:two-component system LytT family response regulator
MDGTQLIDPRCNFDAPARDNCKNGDSLHHAHVAGIRVDRIAVKLPGSILVVRVKDIDWIEAVEDYVTLHVGSKRWLVRQCIGTLTLRLAESGFVRIHRSTLINSDRVHELRPLSKGEYTVVLSDGTELKLSRTYNQVLPLIAGYGF